MPFRFELPPNQCIDRPDSLRQSSYIQIYLPSILSSSCYLLAHPHLPFAVCRELQHPHPDHHKHFHKESGAAVDDTEDTQAFAGGNEVGKMIDVAQKASSIEKGGEENSIYSHCSENCVAVLGIGLQQLRHINGLDHIVDAWLSLLPLREEGQGKKQIRLVMKLVEENPVQLITNQKSLVELMRIYGEFIEPVGKNPRKDHQWLLEDKRKYVQQQCNSRLSRDALNLWSSQQKSP